MYLIWYIKMGRPSRKKPVRGRSATYLALTELGVEKFFKVFLSRNDEISTGIPF
jgi:hypothetical protein